MAFENQNLSFLVGIAKVDIIPLLVWCWCLLLGLCVACCVPVFSTACRKHGLQGEVRRMWGAGWLDGENMTPCRLFFVIFFRIL
jgi:hypothetical protein